MRPQLRTPIEGPNRAVSANRVVCQDFQEAAPWGRFLASQKQAHVEQSLAWGRLKQAYGWDPVWVWLQRGTKILGGAMLLTRKAGGFAKIAYIERGPVWDLNEAGAADLVTQAVAETLAALKVDYLAVAPPYYGGVTNGALDTMRLRRKPENLPPTGVGEATLLIDLRQSIDELLADMSMTKRQNLRRAVRKGVRVRLGDERDAETIRALVAASCRRRGLSLSPQQPDYFSNMWRLMAPAGLVKFFLAELEGEPLSAAVVHVFQRKMQLWRVGWSGTHIKHNPNDLLHWEAMKWAKEQGCEIFDFMHIRPDHARMLMKGERPRDSYAGVTEFKVSYGGQLLLLPDLLYGSFHPVVDVALAMGGARLMETRMGSHCIQALGRRIMKSCF